jgi:hypothetical protein
MLFRTNIGFFISTQSVKFDLSEMSTLFSWSVVYGICSRVNSSHSKWFSDVDGSSVPLFTETSLNSWDWDCKFWMILYFTTNISIIVLCRSDLEIRWIIKTLWGVVLCLYGFLDASVNDLCVFTWRKAWATLVSNYRMT